METSNTQKIGERKTNITRITLLEEDGSETIINVTEDLHYFFGFMKVSKEGGVGVPMELLIKGDVGVCSEMFYQLGEAHPALVNYCAKKAAKKIIGIVADEMKKQGKNPMDEILKNMPGPEGVN